MAIREYIRICKQAGCGKKFIVSAPSIEEDRLIGFSEPEYCPKHRAMHARSYSRIACHHYEVELTPEGQELVKFIERQKKVETQGSQDLAGRLYDPWEMPGNGLGPGGVGRFQRPLRGFIENKEFEPQKKVFQIVEKSDEILAALDDHQVVILVGTTGSGKSTYVPWLLLTGGEPGKLSKWARRGPICITQPRIQATQQIPRFIANSLNGTSVGMGAQIGFTHSKEDAFDRRSRLVFMTDGKLINSIVSGTIGNYSIVMIDEAHERSVNIELILGLLRDQLYLYPHLRVIIASATIDFSAFLTYFYPSLSDEIIKFANSDLRTFNYFSTGKIIPFIYSEGRRFDIVKHFWGEDIAFTDDDGKKEVKEFLPDWWKKIGGGNGQLPTRDQLPSAITELVRDLCKYLDSRNEPTDDKSHILVFLPGSHEINKTVSMIRALKLDDVVVFPLYAQRPLDEQEEALKPDPEKHKNTFGKRRVVVSTNVAETSLTVEGVRYVIDSGYIKASYWNPYLEISELQTLPHSKSGVRQRWGRAGRTSSGHSFMLYTRKQFEDNFPDYTVPEIARSSLEQVILIAKSAGVRSTKIDNKYKLDFSWMPLARSEDNQRLNDELDRAFNALIDQGAIDSRFGDLTRLGLELRGMPAELDVARIFTIGEQHALGIEVATLLPFLSSERGLQTVLEWNNENDSYTKFQIRLSHLDFFYGCEDDLDIYLKLWTLWDRLTSKQRQKWGDQAGLNYKNFDEQIDAERRKLLEMAIDWRKAENRPISLHKLDTLRALIAFSLQKEIFQPVSLMAENDRALLDRFQLSDALATGSYLDDDVYQEYDDEFQIDASCSITAEKQSGLYRRLFPKEDETENSANIEIAPISICFGDIKENDLVVICQRRANYMRSAKSKILGLNVIKIERDWLKDLNGSLVERSLLYSKLTNTARTQEQIIQIRLFLPWLLPRGKQVSAKIISSDSEKGIIVEIPIRQRMNEKEWVNAIFKENLSNDRYSNIDEGSSSHLNVKGYLKVTNATEQKYNVGNHLKVEIVGFIKDRDEPFVIVKNIKESPQKFEKFAKKYSKKIDEKIEVELCEILEDPLGRNPLFLVRERETGLEIPMADTDFCGNNHPQLYFGSRFNMNVEDFFEVTLLGINDDLQEVYLSRGKQLLEEFLAIPHKNNEIVELPIIKVDHLGVYFALAGTGNRSNYVGFTQKSMWPLGFHPEIGMKVEARFRRLERSLDPQKIKDKLEKGEPIPDEIDLGVDLDLRTPPAFKRFYKEKNVGQVVDATIEKYLDSGGLLLGMDYGLKAVVYPSELGFDQEGRLKKARDYQLGKIVDVLISYMNKYSAKINCSISRTKLPLILLQVSEGKKIDANIVFIDKYYKDRENSKVITCSFGNEKEFFPVEVICSTDDAKNLEVGSPVKLSLTQCDRVKLILSGKLEE